MTNDNKQSSEELNRIFQRVNYFLVGTAFLITAFATIIASDNFFTPKFELVALAHVVNGVGFYLAIFFTITNYWNVKILKQQSINQCQPKYTLQSLISEMLGDSCHLLKRPFDLSKGHPAPHTWLVPMGFSISWLLIWFLVLPDKWVPAVIGVCPLIVLIIISLITDKGQSEEGKNVNGDKK